MKASSLLSLTWHSQVNLGKVRTELDTQVWSCHGARRIGIGLMSKHKEQGSTSGLVCSFLLCSWREKKKSTLLKFLLKNILLSPTNLGGRLSWEMRGLEHPHGYNRSLHLIPQRYPQPPLCWLTCRKQCRSQCN